jgi:methyl-accepting chemotaxis protein
VKLNNLTIVPKLGILVSVTLFGLCVAGVLAGYLMQREMLNARIDQVHAIVDMGRNLAIGLQKQVDAGQLTKEAALAEFGRRANSLTYDNGAGYLFGTNYDGITVLSPDPKQVGTNRMDIVVNGRMISHELMDGVRAKGEILVTYDYVRPGEDKPIRKIGYAVAVPGWNMYLGTGAYLEDLDAKLKPVIWSLGIATLIIALVSGGIAWLIGRSISRPLSELGARMRGLADGALDGEIPGIERGDEVGKMAATVQIFKDNALRIRGLEKVEAETQQRAGVERRAAMESIASDFERSVKGIVSSVATAAKGMQATAQSMTATASDASARAATVGAASDSASNNVGTVAAAAEELSSSVTEISR